MIRLIIYIVILVLATWAGFLLQKDPGYLLVSYGQWTAETSLWFGLAVILMAFLVLYWLIRFVKLLFNSHGHVIRWFRQKSFLKAHSVTGGGLLALHQADWSSAEKLLLRGVGSSSIPVVNYIGAAKAANAKENYKKRDQYLLSAEKAAKDSQERMAVMLTKAQLFVEQEAYEQALAVLNKVEEINGKQPLLFKLRYQIYQETASWQLLVDVLPRVRKSRMVKADELDAIELIAYQELLAACKTSKVELQTLWQKTPKGLRKETALVAMYVDKLYQAKACEEAAAVIEAQLKNEFDKDLVFMYGDLRLAHWQKQLKQIQRWCDMYGESEAVLNAVAQIQLRANLFEEALATAKRSLELAETQRAYRVLAKVYSALGDHDHAQIALQKI